MTYVARKVFRNARALEDHQATEHYQRWHQVAREARQRVDLVAARLLRLLLIARRYARTLRGACAGDDAAIAGRRADAAA